MPAVGDARVVFVVESTVPGRWLAQRSHRPQRAQASRAEPRCAAAAWRLPRAGDAALVPLRSRALTPMLCVSPASRPRYPRSPGPEDNPEDAIVIGLRW